MMVLRRDGSMQYDDAIRYFGVCGVCEDAMQQMRGIDVTNAMDEFAVGRPVRGGWLLFASKASPSERNALEDLMSSRVRRRWSFNLGG